MKTKVNKEFGIVGMTIELNVREMDTLVDQRNRVEWILKSHSSSSEKKQYLTDEDLLMLKSILTVLTKGYQTTNETNAFVEEFDACVEAEPE